MRSVMAEMYAIHFNAEELAGIDAFFATPIGASYARKSFSMTSDPRLMGAMMQSMPEMMGDMGEIEAEIAAATADLPPARGYADLSEGERARLAELLGLTAEDMEWQLNPALWEEEYPADGAMIEHSDDHDYGPAPTEAASGSTPVAKQPL